MTDSFFLVHAHFREAAPLVVEVSETFEVSGPVPRLVSLRIADHERNVEGSTMVVDMPIATAKIVRDQLTHMIEALERRQ